MNGQTHLRQIVKRTGEIAPFSPEKIEQAIFKAMRASGVPNRKEARRLCSEVVASLEKNSAEQTPHVEQVQDAVEQALYRRGDFALLKNYMLYRRQHEQLRESKELFSNLDVMDDYLSQDDWRVKESANSAYSLQGLNQHISTMITSQYWLGRLYSEEVADAHKSGAMHIHDLGFLSVYCVGWDLKDLLTTGFKGVEGKAQSAPARHLRTALGQIVNFFYTMQGEAAGAQAFSNFDTFLAPYVRYDGLDYAQVKQCLQEFLFNLNVPTRVGFQTPFTNITMDLTVPDFLKNEPVVCGGEVKEETYGDFQPEMTLLNKAFAEVMYEGDAAGSLFSFPIPTYNITKDFDWDSPNTLLLFRMTAKYGLPYFQNFINSDLKPNMIRSMCCRLQLDLRELLKRGNGLFGSAEQTGSIGVVTINCARLGYLFKSDGEGLYKRLDHLLEMARDSLEVKRKVIQRYMDQGLFPYTKRYLGTLRNHFSTIGVNGMNEMIRNFTNDEHDITDDWGHAFALKILDHVRSRMVEFQTETGHMYNLEATPAEGTTYRFAKEDKKRFPDILQAGTPEHPYYTNSSQLPVGYTDDPFLALEMQDDLQKKYTGGTVLHLYMNEAVSSAEACRELVRRVLTTFRLPYITVTPTFSICPKHGYISGRHDFCPYCDAELLAKKKAEAAVANASQAAKTA